MRILNCHKSRIAHGVTAPLLRTWAVRYIIEGEEKIGVVLSFSNKRNEREKFPRQRILISEAS